ncbi:hypothetical protein, partial [Legionella worsleiensis]
VDQVKGLQFPVVVLYRMVEDEALLEANKVLAKPEHSYVASSSTAHRPAAGVGNPKFGPPLNRLFTAVTRAQQQIIIIQPPKHQFSHLITACKSVELSTDEFKLELDKQSYSEEKWLELAKKLISKNELELARTIYVNHLQKPADEFEAYIRATKTPPTLSVLESSVASTSSPVAPQPIAASSSSSVDAERSTSARAEGLFAPPKITSGSIHSQRRRGGRRQQDRHASASAQQRTTQSAIADAPPVSAVPAEETFSGLRFLQQRPMENFLNSLTESTNPGVYLSTQISCGAMDAQKIRKLFFYYPKSKNLITLEHLCKIGVQSHTSLLSQLCSPYNEEMHEVLKIILEQKNGLLIKFALRLKDFLVPYDGYKPEYDVVSLETLESFFPGSSIDIRELYFLNTSQTGIDILTRMAEPMGYTLDDLCLRLKNFFYAHLEPDFKIPVPLIPCNKARLRTYEQLALDLHRNEKRSWASIIARYNIDDISRNIVRLMVQGNCLGIDLCGRNTFSHLSVFFGDLINDNSTSKVFGPNALLMVEEILSTLKKNPTWTLIEEKRYIWDKLNAPELDPTSNLAGILRIIYDCFKVEHQLLNRLYCLNVRLWDGIIAQFGEVFANPMRLKTILEQMSVNDGFAKMAWNHLVNTGLSSPNNLSSSLGQFFDLCRQDAISFNLKMPRLFLDIMKWFEENPSSELTAQYDFITQCLRAMADEPFSLLAGYLRFAHDALGKQLIPERTKQRQPVASPLQITTTQAQGSAVASSSVQVDTVTVEESVSMSMSK